MATVPMSEILNSLASQLGLENEQDLKKVLSDTRLTELQLPEELAGKFKSGFLTVNSAKNHAEVNAHYKVKHLKGIDNRLQQELKAVNAPEELLSELSGITDTLEKVKFVIPRLHEHYQGIVNEGGKGGDKKYQEMVEKYNATIKEKENLVKGFDQERTKWAGEKEQIETNYEINSLMGGYQFSENYNPDDVRVLIQRRLSEKPVIFKRVDGQLGVFQKENPDLRATKDNKELTIKDVLNEVVTPYLKKNGGGQQQNQGQQHQIPPHQKPQTNLPGADKLSKDIERVRQLREGKLPTT